jgi:hypothetical protein
MCGGIFDIIICMTVGFSIMVSIKRLKCSAIGSALELTVLLLVPLLLLPPVSLLPLLPAWSQHGNISDLDSCRGCL